MVMHMVVRRYTIASAMAFGSLLDLCLIFGGQSTIMIRFSYRLSGKWPGRLFSGPRKECTSWSDKPLFHFNEQYLCLKTVLSTQRPSWLARTNQVRTIQYNLPFQTSFRDVFNHDLDRHRFPVLSAPGMSRSWVASTAVFASLNAVPSNTFLLLCLDNHSYAG